MVRHGTSMISQKATDWATSDAAKCIVAGAVTFAGSLSLSTAIQYQTRLISTGTPVPIPTLAGMASVAASSWACHQAALFTNHCLQLEQHRKSNNLPNLPLVDRATDYWTTWNQRRREALRQSDPLDVLQLGNFRIPWHTIRVCAIGMLAFRALGGRFCSIAPSSYTHVGAFARWSIPATKSYATAKQRLKIVGAGKLFGCHTCGKRASEFVGDHMPPRAVAEVWNRRRRLFGLRRSVKFRFFPQCVDCSGKQGGILSRAIDELKRKRNASHQLYKIADNRHFHGLRFKLIHHLAGGSVAAAAVVGASDADLSDARYRQVHDRIISQCRQARQRISRLIGS